MVWLHHMLKRSVITFKPKSLGKRFQSTAQFTAGGTAAGLVGLPNVGKSTVFNALTRTQAAEASNFPFCTIEPNVARVSVPDPRLDLLARLLESERIIPSTIELCDIAGLVKGASEGQGLGNKFLGNIRSASVIVHVIRCFEDVDVHHVGEVTNLNPVDDLTIIENELVLADIGTIEKRMDSLKGPKKDSQKKILSGLLDALMQGTWCRDYVSSHSNLNEDDMVVVRDLHLLTSKPVMYLCNVDEDSLASGTESDGHNKLSRMVKDHVGMDKPVVVVCGKLEEEIAGLLLESSSATSEGEKMNFEQEYQNMLTEFGLNQSGLSQVVQICYQLLGLQSFFTAGPAEARAWSIPVGATAQQAAAKIHSDISTGFITAETIAYRDYAEYESVAACKAKGKLRHEGKDYVCQDGDVFNFKFRTPSK